MNGASKILTVSYGTFSCTLEGFDDPFNTMRAIAEYFRDLAADDRYFGAEPPIPDAAMLTRIAEREVQRRVEAKVGDNGVVLRAEDASVPRVTMPSVQPPQAPTPAPALASVAEAASAVESAAARLSRLRAAQAQILAPAPAAVLGDISSRFADVEAYAEDQDAETAFKPALVTVPVAEAVVAAPVINLIEDFVQTEPVIAEAAPPVTEAVDADAFEADTAPAAEPVLDSLRETLAGLIAQDDQLAEDMANAADEPAFVASDFATGDDALPEDNADFADLPDMAQFDAPVEAVEQSDLDDLSALDGAAPIIDDAAYLDAEPVADVAEIEEAEIEDAEIEDADQTAEEAPIEARLPEIVISPDAPVIAEKIQRARARVIKIRRLDKKPEVSAARLSPEAEADLQNTLAALEAEIEPAVEASLEAQLDAELAGTGAEMPLVQAADQPAESKMAATDEAAVDRLLAQTNTQLEVPETKRRRSAIAHLKAAVLATVGDRRNTPNAKAAVAEVKMDPYRKDLSQAVRPTSTPLGERPAPLVLVSAQRIDRKRDAVADANRPVPQIVPSTPAPVHASGPAMPVRPRRVASGGLAQAVSVEALEDDDDLEPQAQGNIFADGSKQSFAEFAEGLGANSMAELIEAAGAYCTLVLERPSFTRPQLFQHISTMPQLAELNREDSLRGFGKLLRDGRIQKTVRGQFALSETSPILTEARRIAG